MGEYKITFLYGQSQEESEVSMSIAYGLLNPAFDKPIVFYFEKFKKNDKKYNK